ncbi:MAG: glycosyltransferase family 2 protein [Rickettsiaceae bacterium]|nr:glycosyltransferase family 2 protein [Rickettsiaceae bacterium]
MEYQQKFEPLIFGPNGETYDPELLTLENYKNFDSYIKNGIAYGYYNQKEVIFAIEGTLPTQRSKETGHIVLSSSKRVFYSILETKFAKYASFLAKHKRRIYYPKSSGHIFKQIFPRLKIISLFLLTILTMSAFGILYIALNLMQLLQVVFKILIFRESASADLWGQKSHKVNYDLLPKYSILVPLYREAGKVAKIVRALNNINYPKDKLDIKLIVEQDDHQTLKSIRIHHLAEHYHVIKVPPSKPRTKPKACNYALNFVTGEYIVIYDAEDTPDSDQLMKAVAKFEELDDTYVCLQASLEINAKSHDILGQLFKIEYSIWFKFILSGLALQNLPITLGGSSNHFRVRAMSELCGWDPYNVTEDAELGARIYLSGLKVAMLNSSTKEEGPISLISWLNQRTRWIKGFMITFVSFIGSDKSNLSIRSIFSIILFIGLSTLSFLSLPIIIYGSLNSKDEVITFFSICNLVLYLSFSWVAAFFALSLDSKPQNFTSIFIVLIYPLYFILHTIAAYFALAEMLISPHKWNKTDHNIL